MMTDVFCAFLLDSWKAPSSQDPIFLSVLAGRTSFAGALRKRAFRSHALVRDFAEHLADLDRVSSATYPLFAQALRKVALHIAEDDRKKIHWDRECAQFAQVLHGSLTRVQVALPHEVPPATFGTFVRVYKTLLGGSRVFSQGALQDTSWIGRVRAFTQRISF